MEISKIALLAAAYLCAFGALFGGLTLWVCPEAYTIGRPPVFASVPVWLLGPLWGVVEYLTPGVLVGAAMGAAGNIGPRPGLRMGFFHRPLFGHVLFMLFVSTAGALIGYFAVKNAAYEIVGPMQFALEPEQYPRLGAVWWAMIAAHLANAIGALAIVGWTWNRRGLYERLLKERQQARR